MKDRLEILIKHFCNGNKRQFSLATDVSPTIISNLTGGRENKPSFEVTQKILSTYPDLNPEWFIMGKGQMIIDSLKDRLSYVMLLIGTDNASECLDIDKYDLIDYCNGGKRPYKEFNFEKLLDKYSFSREWILFGKGEKFNSGTQEENEKDIREQIEKDYIEKNNKIINEHINSSPTINQDFQGSPYYNVDFIGGFDMVMNDQTINPDYYINYPPYNKEGVVWCNLTGRSMEPELSNGDIIALKPMTSPIEYLPTGEIYAIITEDYRTVKRIKMSDRTGFVRLIPSNKEYQEQEIPITMITKVYAVLGSIRKFF